MRISKELAVDLKYLSERLEWGDADKEEVKRCLKGDPAFFSHFLSVWAKAVRAGYNFKFKDRFVKLAEFCSENGLPDPYQMQFTDKQVDA